MESAKKSCVVASLDTSPEESKYKAHPDRARPRL